MGGAADNGGGGTKGRTAGTGGSGFGSRGGMDCGGDGAGLAIGGGGGGGTVICDPTGLALPTGDDTDEQALSPRARTTANQTV